MHGRPVVSNNTPLVALTVLERLDLLRSVYGEVLVPPAVRSEYLAAEHELRRVTLQGAGMPSAVA